MVDLYGQYDNIKTEIDNAIAEVLASTQFIKGPQIKLFEESLGEYLNIKHVITCANGTDALQIAMMALDLKPGDEIIIPAFTYVATAEVIALLRLKPVLVDVNLNTFCIEPNAIDNAITQKTKAIVPVHLFGQCANMEDILSIAKKHNLFIIEDAAQAIGSKYTINNNTYSAGGIGHIGTTSFFPSKNLGCFGDGGALFTNDDSLAEKIRMICNHGQKQQYIHDMVGVNSRLDTLQAAILNVKLKYLNEYTLARQSAAMLYNELLSNISHLITPVKGKNTTHVFHQYTVKITNGKRDKVKQILRDNGIPTMIYYPMALHQQVAYKAFGSTQLINSEQLCKEVLSLPMHTELTKNAIEHIATELKLALGQ